MSARNSAIVVLALVCSVFCRALFGQVPSGPNVNRTPHFRSAPHHNNLPRLNDVSRPSGLPFPGWPVAQTPATGSLPPTEVVAPPEMVDSPAAEDPPAVMEPWEESESWILPTYWFTLVDWDGGIEIGVNGTEGNAEALSVRAGGNLKRKTELHEITADITYLKARADGVETQHNALFNTGLERFLGESRWTFFLKEALEYDEFRAFDLRLAVNSGFGYQFIKTETTKLKGRYGAGVSHEFGGMDDAWVPEVVYGMDFERQLTERQKLSLKVDYFPEWGNFRNYRLVSDLGWEVLLDEEHNLNLKLSLNDRYDSTPDGARPNDINYALLLLWKL